ncbi:MAG: hypothetical protein WCQ64_07220 [Acidobacteriota bacterium]
MPKWFKPVVVVALLWNLMGCLAYLADVMVSPEAIAKMSAAEQALRAARPAWSVGATAIGVWFGAAGCVALLLRKSATMLLVVSLLGVIVQDISLAMIASQLAALGTAPLILQGLVLLVCVGLVWLSRSAEAQGWIGAAKPSPLKRG